MARVVWEGPWWRRWSQRRPGPEGGAEEDAEAEADYAEGQRRENGAELALRTGRRGGAPAGTDKRARWRGGGSISASVVGNGERSKSRGLYRAATLVPGHG